MASDKSVEEAAMVLVKQQYHKNKAAFWIALQPETMPPVRIQDIKRRELYKKLGPFVPPAKRKEWRYYHEAPPVEKLEEVAEHTKVARKQRQSRS
jgi:hypothetical protein